MKGSGKLHSNLAVLALAPGEKFCKITIEKSIEDQWIMFFAFHFRNLSV